MVLNSSVFFCYRPTNNSKAYIQVLKYALTYAQTIYYQVVVSYFPTCLLIYDLLLIEGVTVRKPDINSGEVHAQLSHDKHPVDGVLVVTSSLWPIPLVFGDRLLTQYYTLRIDWNL
jgi:hypothetical protein